MFLVTIVDYRWNLLANISVQFYSSEQYYQESYTNKYGQVKFYVNAAICNRKYIQISVGDITEYILSTDHEITIRIHTINQDTGEMYDQELRNEYEIQ
ncbi:hypothetical protein I4U23_008928 [Adineta vaga]|nr:hypothetical protein I4U23_008928 [Adineta vaga]